MLSSEQNDKECNPEFRRYRSSSGQVQQMMLIAVQPDKKNPIPKFWNGIVKNKQLVYGFKSFSIKGRYRVLHNWCLPC